MIIIAISWIILLLFFIPSGIALRSFLKINTHNSYITLLLGVFAQCVFLSICSFFYKIGLAVFILNFSLLFGFSFLKLTEMKAYLKKLINDIQSLSFIGKISMLFLLLSSLFKCAQSPFIIDNESYYLQTIKWINEYGYVKGLGNLHPFLAQTSAFHVLQAGFNFNFLTDRINDLNGLILFISSIYFISEFEKKQTENNQIHWIGLVPILTILYFQFINAPSPDLSLILVSQMVFYYFLDQENSNENFKIITLLFLYTLFVKITVAPFVLLSIYLLLKTRSRLYFFGLLGSILGLIFILKNIILTGYPLYPFDILPLNVDWKIPQSVLDFIATNTKRAGYFKTDFIENPTMIEKVYSWWHLGGINRLFNVGIILLFILGLLVKNVKTQAKYRFLYAVLALHFILLLFTSPQFRFFLPEFVFLFAITASQALTFFKIKFKTIQYIVLGALIIPVVLIEFIDYKDLTKNKLHQQKEQHRWTQILLPEKNSKYADLKFEKIKNGNLIYNSPIENFFFYGTANGDLPCVNKVQINYFEKYYHIEPQLRTSRLGDGFYSKNLTNND